MRVAAVPVVQRARRHPFLVEGAILVALIALVSALTLAATAADASTGHTRAHARKALKIRLLHGPARSTASRSVRVAWNHHRGWSYRCKLDHSRKRFCRRTFRTGRLTVGRHTLVISVNHRRVARTVRWVVKPGRSPDETLASAVTPLAADVPVPAPPPPASTPVAMFHRYAQGWNAFLPDPAGAASHYRIVVLEPSATKQHAELLSTGGKTKILFYTDPLSTTFATRRIAPEQMNTSVDYVEAAQDHPEWFLRKPDGDPVIRHYTPTETDYLMDVGSTSYQDQVVANVLAQARTGGWDGVFLDDVRPTVRYWVPSGQPGDVAKYPTDAAFQAAYRSFLQNVGTRLRAAGLLVIANVFTNETRTDWAQFVDGTLDEAFVNPMAGPTDQLAYESGHASSDWRSYLGEIVNAERRGKLLLTETTGPAGDADRGRYGLATVLLAANGETSFEYHSSDVADNWMADDDTALQLGPPSGIVTRLRSGLYERRYANGIVLVNPQAPGSAPATTSLGGSFSGSGLSHVSSVSMPAVSGLILLRD